MTTKDEVRSTVEALRTERALKLALEALERLKKQTFHPAKVFAYEPAITAIRVALAAVPEAHKQPAQQEAQIVRWKCPCGNEVTFRGFTEAPASKTWAGLTDEELYEVFPAIATYTEANKTLYRSLARAIEAKLKEKHNG